MPNNTTSVADKLRDDLLQSRKTRRMKVRTLMNHFNYDKRTEECTAQITQLLFERDIILHPSIMKIEDNWQLKFDDQVYLSLITKNSENEIEQDNLPADWNSDGWFDRLNEKLEFIRNEKEVESKLMIPLLTRLGYTEKDRYDGRTFKGANGSKETKVVVDFALSNNEKLPDQVLLIAEAKREERLVKSVELINARNQVKSYGVFSGCLYGLITDAKTIEVIALYPVISDNGKELLFKCNLDQLKNNFREIYKLISKDSLTDRYDKLLKRQD